MFAVTRRFVQMSQSEGIPVMSINGCHALRAAPDRLQCSCMIYSPMSPRLHLVSSYLERNWSCPCVPLRRLPFIFRWPTVLADGDSARSEPSIGIYSTFLWDPLPARYQTLTILPNTQTQCFLPSPSPLPSSQQLVRQSSARALFYPSPTSSRGTTGHLRPA